MSPHQHLRALRVGLSCLDRDVDRIERWGAHLADVLVGRGRLLAAGNGGSAAQAQHLTAELVGRFRDDRPPYSAIALCAETSSLTAIGNDYGYHASFARQVVAHGRPGDVLVLLSTSGRSENVLACVEPAKAAGLNVWAITGAGPNPLADSADDAVCIPGETTTVQELTLVAIHLLCGAAEPVLQLGLRETVEVAR